MFGSLDNEAVFLVETDRGRVVCIHRQFNPLQVQPVISQVEHSGHEAGTKTQTPIIRVERHPQHGRMFEAGIGLYVSEKYRRPP